LTYKTEYSVGATLLAASGGLVCAIIIWFVFSRYFGLQSSIAGTIGGVIGGVEYFVLRYILSQKYMPRDKDR